MHPSLQTFIRVVGISSITLIALEITLRLAGRLPAQSRNKQAANYYVDDPILGWRKKPGVFFDGDTRISFLENNQRVTRPQTLTATEGSRIVIIGDSFTQGDGLSDEETYPWKLQAALPRDLVINLGTAAYSTFQALLTLRQYLADNPHKVSLVMYGYVDFHKYRNIAHPGWLSQLADKNGSAHLALPYCLFQERLECYPPTSNFIFPLREWFAIIPFFEELSLYLARINHLNDGSTVTAGLIQELSELARRERARYITVFLASVNEPHDQELAFLKSTQVPFVDCVDPQSGSPELTLPKNKHPNGRENSFWADCISHSVSFGKLESGLN